MTERKLVTVEDVISVEPVENADSLDVATVRGWHVVVRRGEFAVGDKVLYFEIDSLLPQEDERFAFLMPRGTRTFTDENNVEHVGHVLKTIRLRGQISQGLILPISEFPEVNENTENIAEVLNVVKYEKPVPTQISGQTLGNFPLQFAPKTDAERVQNLTKVYSHLKEKKWYATEKVDGTSVTCINDGGNIRICSRNWEQKVDDNLTSYATAKRMGLIDALPEGMVFQAELAGPNIQGNGLSLEKPTLYVFAVLSHGEYLPRSQWPAKILEHAAPVYGHLEFPNTPQEAVEQVDGIKSLITPSKLAEGVVWHTEDASTVQALGYRTGFKAISNKWLIKDGK